MKHHLLIQPLLVFLCIFECTVASTTFIYSHAPEDQITEARALGEYERKQFEKELAKIVHDDVDKMKEMELYSKHMMGCSSIGLKLTQHLQQKIGEDLLLDENSPKAKAQQILTSIGFDDTAAKTFTLPSDEIKEVIKMACLKHELQFQCADSFVNDREKLRENIERMKAIDGNVKVMFEQECADDSKADIPRIYSCIGDAASELQASCSSPLFAFNASIKPLTHQIHNIYRHTIEEVMSVDDETTEEVQQRISTKIEATMNEIRRLEAFGCRVYKQVEKCVVNTMVEMCGDETREVAETLLRVGRLRKQRGDLLNDHLIELNIVEHKHCSKYV